MQEVVVSPDARIASRITTRTEMILYLIAGLANCTPTTFLHIGKDGMQFNCKLVSRSSFAICEGMVASESVGLKNSLIAMVQAPLGSLLPQCLSTRLSCIWKPCSDDPGATVPLGGGGKPETRDHMAQDCRLPPFSRMA